jgi:hypothetical protein
MEPYKCLSVDDSKVALMELMERVETLEKKEKVAEARRKELLELMEARAGKKLPTPKEIHDAVYPEERSSSDWYPVPLLSREDRLREQYNAKKHVAQIIEAYNYIRPTEEPEPEELDEDSDEEEPIELPKEEMVVSLEEFNNIKRQVVQAKADEKKDPQVGGGKRFRAEELPSYKLYMQVMQAKEQLKDIRSSLDKLEKADDIELELSEINPELVEVPPPSKLERQKSVAVGAD